MPSSLRGRIILVVACCVVLVEIGLAIRTFSAIHDTQEAAEQRAVVLARTLARMPNALSGAAGADQTITRLLSAAGDADPDLRFAVLTDVRGKALARYARPASGGGPADSELPRLADPDYRSPAGWKLVDVTVENRERQAEQRLRIAYSQAGARARALRSYLAFTLLVLVMFGIAMAGASAAARRLAAPLELLATTARRADQTPIPGTPGSASDEIKTLYDAFQAASNELRSRDRLHSNFARFVSEAVAHKVISDDLTVRLGGERRVVTVLFADIRGFTHFSAGQAPERVVAMLNEYFQALADVIPRYGGMLDKFMGDALMAVFNAPAALENHEICAVMCAIDMHRVMTAIDERRRAAGQQELRLGIGINTGEVVAGTFGSEKRLEYTVIGAPVNLAQRIEGQARNGEMLLGQTTYEAVRHLVEAVALDPVLLKGLEHPAPLYQVTGLKQKAGIGR